MSPTAGDVGGVFVALYAAHQVADHWIQTQHQADTKGQPGWRGRIACASHVTTYTIAAAVALALLWWRTDLQLHPLGLVAGLGLSAVTHYVADRRTPLRRIAEATGSGAFYQLNTCGLNGAYLLDQAWHVGWLIFAALLVV